MRTDQILSIPSRRHLLAIAGAAAAMASFSAPRAASARDDGKGGDDGEGGEGEHSGHHCLLRGTEILTDHGPVPIESLAIGDLVLTDGGHFKPVKWIGRNSFKKGSHAAWQDRVLPVCIAPSAMDTNLPSKHLYLSPAHALYIDGYLIPVRYLVNGITITPSTPTRFDVLEYFHIEFEQHEVIYAQGAPVESLQVTDGRESFANFAEYERPYGRSTTCMRPYAPALGYYGGRQEAIALVRLAVSQVVDVRDRIQVAYDRLNARAKTLTTHELAMEDVV
jgi:hypothetical protein